MFIYRTIGGDLTNPKAGLGRVDTRSILRGLQTNSIPPKIEISLYERTHFYFLGIHWGQFHERLELRNRSSSVGWRGWPLFKKRRIGEGEGITLETDGTYVEGFSGMTCVIPSWSILEVLNMQKLKDRRGEKKRNRELDMSVPSAEYASLSETANLQHKEDFID